MHERPLLLPLAGLVVGIALAGVFDAFLPLGALLPLVVLSLSLLFLRQSPPFLLSVFLLFLMLGNLSIGHLLRPPDDPGGVERYAEKGEVSLEGVVVSRPRASSSGSRILIEAEGVRGGTGYRPVHGRLLLYVAEGRFPFLRGDRICFRGELRRPREMGLPGEFPYVRQLALQRVYATARVSAAGEVFLLAPGPLSPSRRLDALAARLAGFIRLHVPGEEGEVLCALLLGDRGGVPRPLEDAYSRAGVNHILSISGFHIGVIAATLYQLLLFALRRRETLLLRVNVRLLALVAVMPVIVFYLLLTGAAPATVRSVLMALACTAALLVEREVDPVHVLCLAALGILAAAPGDLFDPSFQLSFLALWGIIVLTPYLVPAVVAASETGWKKAWLLAASSVAAVGATLVPVAFHFHRTTATGILSNLLVIPLEGYGAVVAGVAALPLIPVFPAAASLLLNIAGFLAFLSHGAIELLQRIPLLPYRSAGAADLAVFLLFICGMTAFRRGKARAVVAAASAASFLLLQGLPGDGLLRISFLSVGQAEATLIRFPRGETMLVDGGGSFAEGRDAGERYLAPALAALKVDRIDYMVLTHRHPDHLQGLSFIAENLPVGEFWESGEGEESGNYRRLVSALRRGGARMRSMDADSPPDAVGGVTIRLLAPAGDAAPGENERSLVFRLDYGRFSALFTGDIGAATERMLLRDPSSLRCRVLKVPHHGSRHSSTPPFLRACRAEAALISAGYANRFHLPAQETLERLQHAGASIYRTDRDGTVEVSSDGERWEVRTFRQTHSSLKKPFASATFVRAVHLPGR